MPHNKCIEQVFSFVAVEYFYLGCEINIGRGTRADVSKKIIYILNSVWYNS